jgi:hypothetical protein
MYFINDLLTFELSDRAKPRTVWITGREPSYSAVFLRWTFSVARLGHTDMKGGASPLQLALTAREFSHVIVFVRRRYFSQAKNTGHRMQSTEWRTIFGALGRIALCG